MANHASKRKTFQIIGIIALTLAVSIWAILTEQELNIRFTGLVLQILGIITVIWGIWVTQESFGILSPISKLKNLIRKVKSFLNNRDRVLKEYYAIFNSENAIHVYGPHEKYKPIDYEPGTNHTLETLAKILKENINSIQERISQTQREIDREIDEVFQKTVDNLRREEQTRQNEDNKIREKLAMTSMGGFHISISGAILLSAGVILSTAPNEIICLFFSKDDIASYPIPILIPGINVHLT